MSTVEAASIALFALLVLLVVITFAVLTWASRQLRRPLARVETVLQRLDRGDLAAVADDQDGPHEVRALAAAVNTVGNRLRADALADRDAEQFRRRCRLISATIRRTTSSAQMADQLSRGIGEAFEVDRVWLHTFAQDRVPGITVQWQRDGVASLPELTEPELAVTRELATSLWRQAHAAVVDDHRYYVPEEEGGLRFSRAGELGATASMVIGIGDGVSAFGALWISMTDRPRRWSTAEIEVAQHLASELAHGLVQAHVTAQYAAVEQRARELESAENAARLERAYRHTPQHGTDGVADPLADGLAPIGSVDVGLCLRSVAQSLAGEAANAGVELTDVRLGSDPDGQLCVDTDPVELAGLFRSLLTSAIQLCPAGSHVTLLCEPDVESGALVEIGAGGTSSFTAHITSTISVS